MADESPEDSPTDNEEPKPKDEEKPDESSPPGTEEELTPGAKATNQPLVQGLCISPTPSGEELPEGEIDKIILSTLDILQFCQTKVDEQKIGSHSLAFMLLRIKESLDDYCKDYIPKLNTFLVQADRVTADYYAQMCCFLPKYGDYVRAIEAEEIEKVDVGGGDQVSKRQLLSLVKNVTDNYHAAAMCLKSSRAVYKDVNSLMRERKDIVYKIIIPTPNWMGIQDIVACQLESIREQIFQISAYLNFLKQDESKTRTTLDLTAQDETLNSSVTPKKTKKQSEKPADTSKHVTPNTTTEQAVKPLEPSTTMNQKEEKLEPTTTENQKEEKLEPSTTVNQTETSTDNKKDVLPSETTETDSDDDIFDPKGRIRKYNK